MIIRFLVGLIVLLIGCAVVGLDLHIAFKLTQFAHPVNLGIGVVIVGLGVYLMWPKSVEYYDHLGQAVRYGRRSTDTKEVDSNLVPKDDPPKAA